MANSRNQPNKCHSNLKRQNDEFTIAKKSKWWPDRKTSNLASKNLLIMRFGRKCVAMEKCRRCLVTLKGTNFATLSSLKAKGTNIFSRFNDILCSCFDLTYLYLIQ